MQITSDIFEYSQSFKPPPKVSSTSRIFLSDNLRYLAHLARASKFRGNWEGLGVEERRQDEEGTP